MTATRGIDPGRLNRVLDYRPAVEAAGELNQVLPSFPAVALTCRAEVRSPNGRESLAAQAMAATVTHVITTWFPGYRFDPRARLVDVTDPSAVRTYCVVSSEDPDGRRVSLLTFVTEVVSNDATDGSNL